MPMPCFQDGGSIGGSVHIYAHLAEQGEASAVARRSAKSRFSCCSLRTDSQATRRSLSLVARLRSLVACHAQSLWEVSPITRKRRDVVRLRVKLSQAIQSVPNLPPNGLSLVKSRTD